MSVTRTNVLPGWMEPVLRGIPGIVMDPVPHLPLPEPRAEYCLTPMLQTDVEYLPAIFNHPESKTLGYRENGGDMTAELAEKLVEETMGEEGGHYPLQGGRGTLSSVTSSDFSPPADWLTARPRPRLYRVDASEAGRLSPVRVVWHGGAEAERESSQAARSKAVPARARLRAGPPRQGIVHRELPGDKRKQGTDAD